MNGRTVRIFMADGSAFGIRQCEIFNRTIQALSVSRGRLAELREWKESRRSGTYLLFGKNDNGDPKAYIGEAQRVIDRVSTHLREKEFWTEVVIFVNKDENINAKYLESRLISIAKQAARYELDNGKDQELPILSRADNAAMEEMLPDIRLILGVLGHPILEPLVAPAVSTTDRTQGTDPPPVLSDSIAILAREFTFTGPSFEARGRVTDEGFLVLKGSTAAREFTVGNAGYQRLREKLIQDGSLAVENGHLTFTKDLSSNSSSQAASIMAGGNRSGPGSWKSDGKMLGELETDAVSELTSSPTEQ